MFFYYFLFFYLIIFVLFPALFSSHGPSEASDDPLWGRRLLDPPLKMYFDTVTNYLKKKMSQ